MLSFHGDRALFVDCNETKSSYCDIYSHSSYKGCPSRGQRVICIASGGPRNTFLHIMHACDAGEATPVPLKVFEDPQGQEEPIVCYLGCSGIIGDVPFSAIVANATGHSGFKACKHCFMIGQTENKAGEDLKTVRFGGFDEDDPAEAHVLNENGEWHKIEQLCFVKDGVFDGDLANSIRVTPVLLDLLRTHAEAERIEAKKDLPPRPAEAVGDSSAQEEWQDSAVFLC